MVDVSEDDFLAYVKPLQFITAKPVLYVCNVDENSAVSGNSYVEQVKTAVANENAEVLVLAVGTEADINELDDFEERQLFLDDIGLDEPVRPKIGFERRTNFLSLQTYFTAGKKKCVLGP